MLAKLSKCFRCGSSDIEERTVEELVRQGQYVVALRLSANVCSRCGERYLERDDVKMIEDVRQRLDRGDLEGFRVTGDLLELVGASR
jgi:YgiT-type zinc finger domain-containing protein